MIVGLGEFYSLASALAWAIAVILFRQAGASLAPFALNLFKNLLALLLMAVTLALWPDTRWPELPAEAWALMLFSGLIGIGIADTLYFQALNKVGASHLAVAGMMYSPFVILFSMLFLGEQLVAWQFAGIVLVLGGIALVNRPRLDQALPRRLLLIGMGIAVLAVALMAAGIVIAKPLLELYDFLWVVTIRLVGGLLGMLLVVLLRHQWAQIAGQYRRVRHWPQIIWGSVMATYVAMMLWLAGYKYTQASIAAVLNEMAAVFILILAAIFLKDRLDRRQLLGVALAVFGVGLVVWPQ